MVPGEGGEHCLMVRICGGGEDEGYGCGGDYDGENVARGSDDYLEYEEGGSRYLPPPPDVLRGPSGTWCKIPKRTLSHPKVSVELSSS